jgi:hypothetical protein
MSKRKAKCVLVFVDKSDSSRWYLPESVFAMNGWGGAHHLLALVTLQILSRGAELVCKFQQGSSSAEFLSLVSKG